MSTEGPTSRKSGETWGTRLDAYLSETERCHDALRFAIFRECVPTNPVRWFSAIRVVSQFLSLAVTTSSFFSMMPISGFAMKFFHTNPVR